MIKEVDAVVVGAGVAGLTAAEIIGEGGFQTVITASGYGCSQASSGTIDVLGRYKGKNVENLDSALEEFIRENPQHIYAIVGKETVLKALSDFQHKNKELYAGGGGRNLKIITPLGTTKNTYLAQFTMLGASFEELTNKKVMLVVIPGLQVYAPHIIAEKMMERKVDIKIVRLDIAAITPFQLASSIEAHPHTLIGKLKEVDAKDYDAVIIPPILGFRKLKETCQVVEEALGTKILELPSFPPSVPGRRLYLSLRERCERAGVEVVLGKVVTKVRLERGMVKEVLTGGEYYLPSVLVLATGWMLRHIFRIKGLPSWRSKHEFNVKTEGIENIFFARSLVSHEEKIGLGAAITAGYLAGKAALDYLKGRE